MQNCCLTHGKAVGNLLQSFLCFVELGKKLLDALNNALLFREWRERERVILYIVLTN